MLYIKNMFENNNNNRLETCVDLHEQSITAVETNWNNLADRSNNAELMARGPDLKDTLDDLEHNMTAEVAAVNTQVGEVII